MAIRVADDAFSTSADGFEIPTDRSIRYVPLQSESGRKLLQRSGRSPDDISSVVLVEKDRWLTNQYHKLPSTIFDWSFQQRISKEKNNC
jgi:hypothetical protein